MQVLIVKYNYVRRRWPFGKIYLLSNDGTETLESVDYEGGDVLLSVEDNKIIVESCLIGHEWEFEVENLLGVALSPNATVPDYAVGTTKQEIAPGQDDSVNLYIVEKSDSTETTGITFDLSTLNLETGTYSVTVKAKADGYTDSEASNAVDYAA